MATAAEQALGAASQAVDAVAAAAATGASEVALIADQSWYPVLGVQYLIEHIHLAYGVPWCGRQRDEGEDTWAASRVQ